MERAIQIIQTFVTPIQLTRIVDWNKERNDLELDSNLEVNMLSEEAKEYFDAKEFVYQLDAVCDLLFVGTGTLAKTSKAFHLISKGLFGSLDFIMTDFVGRVSNQGISSQHFIPLLSESLDIVIDTNYTKNSQKDEQGKVIKPVDFIPPEAKLQVVIDKFIMLSKNEGALTTPSLFSEEV